MTPAIKTVLFAGILLSPLALASSPEAPPVDPLARAAITGSVFQYMIQRGDTLSGIGARFGVSRATLVNDNPESATTLVAGRTLTVDNRHLAVIEPGARITINIPQRMLFLERDDDISAFPIAVGRSDWPTPSGRFTVVRKAVDPVWTVPTSIQNEMARLGQRVITSMPASPVNPLGARWIGLSLPSLGIHGTVAPSSIYRFASHGCIRMHPDDVAHVFDRVEIGDAGVVTYEPTIMAAIDGRVFLEAHPDIYRRLPPRLALARRIADDAQISALINWTRAAEVLKRQTGTPIDVTAAD